MNEAMEQATDERGYGATTPAGGQEPCLGGESSGATVGQEKKPWRSTPPPPATDLCRLSSFFFNADLRRLSASSTSTFVDFLQRAMQLCSYAAMQLCSYAAMQLCSYAAMQLCSYAAMQLCSYAAMQLCSSLFDLALRLLFGFCASLRLAFSSCLVSCSLVGAGLAFLVQQLVGQDFGGNGSCFVVNGSHGQWYSCY
jgi:hypothetical protein